MSISSNNRVAVLRSYSRGENVVLLSSGLTEDEGKDEDEADVVVVVVVLVVVVLEVGTPRRTVVCVVPSAKRCERFS